MPLPAPPSRKPLRNNNANPAPGGQEARQRIAATADKELLFKGVLCALIGIGVLLAPRFLRSAAIVDMIAQASIVGWFALVLGCAFIGLYAKRRLAAAATTQ